MITIGVNSQSRPVLAMLERLQRGLGDLSEPLASIGQEMESRISARFETETDPDGNPWDPWAPSTEATYPSAGHRRILDRYGDMLRSMSHQVDGENVIVGFGAVASKAGDVYAVYHEFGTEHMPRRGLLMSDPESGTLSQGDETAVLDILSVWISDLAS